MREPPPKPPASAKPSKLKVQFGPNASAPGSRLKGAKPKARP